MSVRNSIACTQNTRTAGNRSTEHEIVAVLIVSHRPNWRCSETSWIL